MVPTVSRNDGGTTIETTIASDDDTIGTFTPSFHVPAPWRADTTVAPFVPLATALAGWYGEPLRFESPMSDELLARARAAMPLVSSHAHQRPQPIDAPTASPSPAVADRPAAVFVSRGVDSSVCMILGQRGELPRRPEIGIVIRGVDYGDLDAFEAASRSAAEEFGLEPLVVTTNAEATVWPRVPYEKVFVAVLAGVGLLLRHHVADLVIGSACEDATTPPDSSRAIHEVWSTEDVAVHHLPRDMARSRRIRILVEDGRPLRWLRVCWRDPVANCGRCRKCLMTLAWLDSLGARERASTFERAEPVHPEELAQSPPRSEFVDDLITTVGSSRPDLAEVARRTVDRVLHPWRWDPDPSDLHAITNRATGFAEERALLWFALTERSHALTGQLATRAPEALGPGMFWPTDSLPERAVIHRAAERSRFVLWAGPDHEFDPIRTTYAMAAGARPVHVVEAPRVDSLRSRLPPAVQPLVHPITELHSLPTEPDSVRQDLLRAFASGGHAWLRSSHHP